MINIDPILINPLLWASTILPFTYIFGKNLGKRFNIKSMPTILALAISSAFAFANYLQFHNILLAGQLGLWILLSAIAFRIGLEIVKSILLIIFILIIIAGTAFIIKCSNNSAASIVKNADSISISLGGVSLRFGNKDDK
jgi:hypothetical protein